MVENKRNLSYRHANFCGIRGRRVGIILYGGIGDIVCLSSVLSGIKKANLDVKLYFLTSDVAKGFFPSDLVEEIIYDDDVFIDMARQGKLDMVINLHSSRRSAVVLGKVKKFVPIFGYGIDKSGSWVYGGTVYDIFFRVFYNVFRDEYIANFVLWGRSAMILGCLGVDVDLSPKVEVRGQVDNIDEGIVVFVPDANADTRKWPIDYYVRLAQLWRKWRDDRIVVLARQKRANFPTGVLDLSGKTSLSEAVSVIEKASVVVSNDTGMIHIAAALGKKVFVICGPNNVGPEAEGDFISVRYPVKCSPCFRPQCESMDCMRRLSPELVMDTIKCWLEGRLENISDELVVGYSFKQKLDIFFDYHPIGDKYSDEDLVFGNVVKWAFGYAVFSEVGCGDMFKLGFEDYFDRFYTIVNFDVLNRWEKVEVYLRDVRSLVLSLRDKVGILSKRVVGQDLNKMVDSIKLGFGKIPKELWYPWQYVENEDFPLDVFFVIVLQRINGIIEFLSFVKENIIKG